MQAKRRNGRNVRAHCDRTHRPTTALISKGRRPPYSPYRHWASEKHASSQHVARDVLDDIHRLAWSFAYNVAPRIPRRIYAPAPTRFSPRCRRSRSLRRLPSSQRGPSTTISICYFLT